MNERQEKELSEKLSQYRSQKNNLERLQRLRRLHQNSPIVLDNGNIKVAHQSSDLSSYATTNDGDFYDAELVNKIKLLLAISIDSRIEEVKEVMENL